MDSSALSLKKGETYLANMRSEDVTHAPWFLGMGVKEDTLYGAEIGPSNTNGQPPSGCQSAVKLGTK